MNLEKKSDYFLRLEKEHLEIASRYKDKIKIILCINPFTLMNEETKSDPVDFPPVEAMDVITYLVFTNSFYTKEQMRAYKSLPAYRYFQSGFVHNCRVKQIGEHIIVVGQVIETIEEMNSSPFSVWVICHTDGSVKTAHCTCIQDLSEVCSHIAALLYSIEHMKHRLTILSCAVNPTATDSNVPTESLSEVECDSPNDETLPSENNSIPPIEGEELIEFLQKIKDSGCDAAILRVVEPFASQYSSNNQNTQLS